MTPAPYEVMIQMLMARTISFSLGAIARLGVADHMTNELMPVETIAKSCGVLPDHLYRILRLLASVNVFQQSGRNFALTPVGAILQSHAPDSLRNMAMMFSSPWVSNSYLQLHNCVTTGKDGVSLAYGKNGWELFPEIPEQADLFQRAMQDLTTIAVRALLEAYDFTGVHSLADVGGGYGTLLAGVLGQYPDMHGVLFDLPEVIAGAQHAGLLFAAGHRVRFESGSFLETAPAGCDAYIMKHIIHDWSDDYCRQILGHIRAKMPSNARLLLFEIVIPETNEPGPGKVLDIEMMIATVGGRERTASEFKELLGSCGFELSRIVPTKSPMCVIEAHPAAAS